MAKKFGSPLSYFPERGDIVWIDFDPSQGSEIKKTRPALIISPLGYNKKVGLALLCPITNKKKGYPFEVEIKQSSQQEITGVILSDQIKSLDWQARNVRFEGKAPPRVMTEVMDKIFTLLSFF